MLLLAVVTAITVHRIDDVHLIQLPASLLNVTSKHLKIHPNYNHIIFVCLLFSFLLLCPRDTQRGRESRE